MRYLVTGHTGFKGAWLTLWLMSRGHEVIGIGLDPRPGSLYERARVAQSVAQDIRLDIRDAEGMRAVFAQADPDVVIHMAAQPLVRESYRDPRVTFTTNVNGTLNVLAALNEAPNVSGSVIITTDKV